MLRERSTAFRRDTTHDPIRVTHVVVSLAIGGLETVVVNLALRAGDRIRPRVICLERLGPLAGRLVDRGIDVECLGTPDTPVMQSVRRLRRRLVEHDPDVLHTHNEKAHIHGALATLGLGRPALVHTRHGRWQVTTRPARLANALALYRSRWVICVSDDAGGVARAEGASPQRVKVIRNGVDVVRYGTQDYEARAGSARAVTVARLAPVKDLATLLRAARLVHDLRRDFRLDVVGDGASRGELEQLSSALGLSEVVTFHGACEDPRPFLATATLFVQSSLSEGISLTLLEAMSAGLPIVATDVGGTREIVVAEHTGLLVPPQNPQALASGIGWVLNDAARAMAMSRAARARAVRDFDVTRMVADYEAVYAEALTPCCA